MLTTDFTKVQTKLTGLKKLYRQTKSEALRKTIAETEQLLVDLKAAKKQARKENTKTYQLDTSAQELPSPTNYRCKECGLFETCKTPFMSPHLETKRKPKFLFIAASTDGDSDSLSRPFLGPAESLLKDKVLAQLGLDKTSAAFTYAVRCYPLANKPEAKHVNLCGAFVWQDIEKLKPDVVVALGSEAAKAVMRAPVTLKKYVGQVITVQNQKVILTYSARTVLAKKDIGYLTSIRKALEVYINNKKPKPFPTMRVI